MMPEVPESNPDADKQQRSPDGGSATAFPDAATLGLSLGFVPYLAVQQLIDVVETELMYPSTQLPDVSFQFRGLEDMIRRVPLLAAQESWRREALDILAAIEAKAADEVYLDGVHVAHSEAARQAHLKATCQQWGKDDRMLQDFLAISPEAGRQEWEQVFKESREKWEQQPVLVRRKPLVEEKTEKKSASLTAISERKDGLDPEAWKAFDEVGLNLISADPAVVGPPMLVGQWDIARCLARVRPRQVASCSDLCQRLMVRLDRMAATTDKLFYHWVKVGRLLGQAYLDCWLPDPAKFRDYLPRAIHDLSHYPEMGALNRDRLLARWRIARSRWRRLSEARRLGDDLHASNIPIALGALTPTHGGTESFYHSPDIPWSTFLARQCLKKYRSLHGILGATSEALAGKGKRLSDDGHIPPIVVLSDREAVILGRHMAVKLTSAERDVLEPLEAAYPEGLTLSQIERQSDHTSGNRYLLLVIQKHPSLRHIIKFPGKRERGGYRLVWPSH